MTVSLRYLRFLLEKFQGNLDLSLAAYNSGENRVARIGRIPNIPETQDYVRKVQTTYRKMRAQPQFETPIAPRSRQVISEPVGKIANEQSAKPLAPAIYQTVDEQGVLHFSNVGPKR